jgi:hypothetical protein
MSHAFYSSMGANTPVARVAAASLLRREYEKVFAASGPNVVDMSDPIAVEGDRLGQPMYWRTVLRDTAEQMAARSDAAEAKKHKMLSHQDKSYTKTDTLRVAYRGKTYEFPHTKRIVLVGVRYGCDIVLQEAGASRLHAVLLMLPHALYILDMGALSGVSIYAREDTTQPLCVSAEPERCVMTCGIEESVVVQLGRCLITLSPRVCIVCMDHLRDVRTNPCHHFVCCSACSSKCTECPQCRAKIVTRLANFHGVQSHGVTLQ